MSDRSGQLSGITLPGVKSRGFMCFLGTQFLGAFNDNAFKFMIIGYAMGVLSGDAARDYVPLAGAMFILPFLVFSSVAGYLSDRFAKKVVMVWTKVLELVIMLAGYLMFRGGHVYGLLVVLFFMGAQSTLFSPGKYGYLPESLPDRELSLGNGLVQLLTFLAIIAGGGVGSYLAEVHASTIYLGSWYCVAVALAGVLFSLGIARTREGVASVRASYDPILPHIRTLRRILPDRALLFAVVGNTYFWLLATIYQSNIPIIVRDDMGERESVMGYLQASLALGIGVGSVLAGCLSHGGIAYHFVIPGGWAVGLFAIIGGLCSGQLWLSLAFACLLGISAGFYQIPLTTCIQQRSPAASRGACLAACNALDCVSMLVGTGLHWVLLKPLGLSGGMVLVVVGSLTLGVMIGLDGLRRRAGLGGYGCVLKR